MENHPPQELFEMAPSILDEFGGKARHGLFFGEGGKDGPGAFFVEAVVEPEKVRVAAEDGGVLILVVLEKGVDYLVVVVGIVQGRGATIHAVGSVFVDAIGVDDGIGDGDIVDAVFGAQFGV